MSSVASPPRHGVPRTVHLIGPVPPPTGGIATHVAALAQSLRGEGCDVRMLALGRGALGSVAGRVGMGSGWALASQLATSLPNDAIVHSHSVLTSYPGFRLLDAFVKVIDHKRAAWLETIHDGRLPDRFARWEHADRRRYVDALSRAQAVVAVSELLGDFLVEAGIEAASVEVISPLLPADRSGDDDAPANAAFFKTHSPVLLGVGATIPLYDFSTLLASFSELRATEDRAGLVLLESTFDQDRTYRGELVEQLTQLGADALVLTDLGGTEVHRLMASSDVVVRGAAKESYGLSRVEAMLAGTPVVGTPVGERRYVYEYEHGHVDSLSTAIRNALRTDPSRLGEARDHFEALARQNLERILALYERHADA